MGVGNRKVVKGAHELIVASLLVVGSRAMLPAITRSISGIEQGRGSQSFGDDKLSSVVAMAQGSSIQRGGGLTGSRSEGRQTE